MIKVFKLLKVYFKYLNCSRQECRATYLDACIACLSKGCNQDVGCGYRHRDRFKDQLWKDVSLSSLTGLLTGSGFSGLVGLRPLFLYGWWWEVFLNVLRPGSHHRAAHYRTDGFPQSKPAREPKKASKTKVIFFVT